MTLENRPARVEPMPNPPEAPPLRPHPFRDVVERLSPQLALVEGAMHDQLGSPSDLIGMLGEHAKRRRLIEPAA